MAKTLRGFEINAPLGFENPIDTEKDAKITREVEERIKKLKDKE